MPRPLSELHDGRIVSHLLAIVTDVLVQLHPDAVDLGRAAGLLNNDPVYGAVAAGFQMPVNDCRGAEELMGLLERFDELDRTQELTTQRDVLRRFLSARPSDWEDKNFYCIVPVLNVETGRPGLLYYQLQPEFTLHHQKDVLHIENLSSSRVVRGYFESVAAGFLRAFYNVNEFPFGRPYCGLDKFSHEFLFGLKIDEGRSAGAAFLAMLAFAYVRQRFPSTWRQYISPSPGTLITGEVDPISLAVKPVKDAVDKIKCGFKEFGGDLKVIVADKEKLDEVEELIPPKRLRKVANAEELLFEFLSDGSDDRGLLAARNLFFTELGEADKNELLSHRRAGVPDDYYDFDPKREQLLEHGVHSRIVAWGRLLDVAVGPDAEAVDSSDQNEESSPVVLLVLDGSSTMERFWQRERGASASRIATLVATVVGSAESNRTELVLGFLGCRQLKPISRSRDIRFNDAGQVQGYVEVLRREHQLRVRGPFFRPVNESFRKLYSGRPARVFVISDSRIPDLEDDLEERIVPDQLPFEANPALGSRALLREDHLDHLLLKACFEQKSAEMRKLTLELGDHIPVEWYPPTGLFSWDGKQSSITWLNGDTPTWKLRIRMMHSTPLQLKLAGILDIRGVETQYSGRVQAVRLHLQHQSSVREGKLTQEEFEQWQTMLQAVSEMRSRLRLFEQPKYGVQDRIIFSSLRDLPDGWLMLRRDHPSWTIFETGCYVDSNGSAVVVVDGTTLNYSSAESRLSAVPSEPGTSGVYRLAIGEQVFYFVHILRPE